MAAPADAEDPVTPAARGRRIPASEGGTGASARVFPRGSIRRRAASAASFLLVAACAAEPRVIVREVARPRAAAAAYAVSPPACAPDRLAREELRIPGGDPGISLFVMRVATPLPRRGAAVIMHGAGSPGSASFDLAGASLLRALACAGFDAYTLDARGFGGSTPPPETPGDAPAVRAAEAARDLDALVRHASATSSVAAVELVGWSWGADVAGLYAGLHPERVRRLVLLAPVYDRRWPSRHVEKGAYREEKRADIDRFFSPEREERAVWDDFLASLFRFGDPAVIRLPNGPYRDIYGPDAPVWRAAEIRAPVLVVRGDQDKASLDVHALKLFADLTNAPEKRYVVLGGLGHFLFREKRRAEVYELIATFLAQSG